MAFDSELPRNWFQRLWDDITSFIAAQWSERRENFSKRLDGLTWFKSRAEQPQGFKDGRYDNSVIDVEDESDWRVKARRKFMYVVKFKWLVIPRGRTGAIATGLLVVFVTFNAFIIWSDGFIPTKATLPTKQQVAGATIAVALRNSIQDELDHGWIPNDVFWPTLLCWNYASFQSGQLEVWRRTAYEMREHLSRVRKTDSIDQNLDAAMTALNNKSTKWMLPSYEGQMQLAVGSLDKYVAALPERGDFSERADNLAELIMSYASMMGATQNQLAQALPTREMVVLQDKTAAVPVQQPSTEAVGFWSSSRIFYQSKGEAYATLIMMEAVRLEYADVLKKKNADALVGDAIFWLKEAILLRPWYVMHSGRDSIFANHLDNFAAPFGQARAKINSLYDVLRNG